MPLHSYKTFLGLAADRVNATLTSAVIATATSLPVSNVNGTPGATYSAVILDGPLTETVACTGSVTAGAIAVAATANAHPAGVYIVFQLTASIGPSAFIPLEKFDPVDDYAQLLDQSYRGSAVKTVGAVQGLRKASFTLAGAVFADTIGYILGGVFGAEDFGAGTPNTHTFSVKNTGNFQPLKFVLYDYDALNTRIYSGRFTEVALALDPAQPMKHATKFLSRVSGVVATPGPSFSSLTFIPSWTAGASVGGTAIQKSMTFNITFTRDLPEQIPTLQGIQDPYDIWMGPLETKGKFTTVKEDDSLYSNWSGETQPAVLITSNQGTSPVTGLNIQMTKCNFNVVNITQQGKAYVTEEVDFDAIGVAADASTSGAGLSPGQVVLKNAIATGVYV